MASLSNVSVAGSGGNGGSEFIIAPLTTILQNPSNISLSTVDVALPVFYQGVEIGRASINVRSDLIFIRIMAYRETAVAIQFEARR